MTEARLDTLAQWLQATDEALLYAPDAPSGAADTALADIHALIVAWQAAGHTADEPLTINARVWMRLARCEASSLEEYGSSPPRRAARYRGQRFVHAIGGCDA